MPKEQFFKLKLEKRQKIVIAARDEFSLKNYDEVSINEIVNRANISRGSFYLYFEDKWDIYSHLLKCTFNSIIARIKESLDRGNNIFFSILDIYDYIIIESQLDESVGFLTNILKSVNPLVYTRIYEFMTKNLDNEYINNICFKESDFVIKAPIEYEMLKRQLIINLIIALTRVLVHNCDPNIVREELRISFNILKYGSFK